MSLDKIRIELTSHPALEAALRSRLRRVAAPAGCIGVLEPLAVQLGLIQQSIQPVLHAPQLVVFAADHGIAVDDVSALTGTAPRAAGAADDAALVREAHATRDTVARMLDSGGAPQLMSQMHGVEFTLVDAGVASELPPHPRLVARKIAYGTRNARLGPAMTPEQAQAALRVGMEVVERLPGNVLLCGDIGLANGVSAALICARLADVPLLDVIRPDRVALTGEELQRQRAILVAAAVRHQDARDPLKVLAAFGGFEIAMTAGAMLKAAALRRLVLADGFAAGAALLLASKIDPAVTDYGVLCGDADAPGLRDLSRQLGEATVLDLRLGCSEGTTALLAWPLIQTAASLLYHADLADAVDPTQPAPL